MEDIKKIQEFFSKPLNENKVTKEDFDKVVKILIKSKYPFTIMLVPKWDEIDIITGQDSPDEIVDDISQRLDSAGLNWGGNSGITISGDSSNYSRREYSDIFRVNGGHKDYYEESVEEVTRYSGFTRNPEDPDSEPFNPTGSVAEFKEDLRALFGKFKGDLKNPEFIKGVAEIMVNWKSLLRSQLEEDKKLTYNDFVQMVRDDIMAGASPDEYVSDERVKRDAKWKYSEYLQGANVDDLFLYEAKEIDEADLNDPVLMKMRAAKMKADKLAKMRAANAGDDGNDKFFDNAKKIAFLKKEREQLMRDMEQEAEPEGGPIADEYGDKLNRIDAAIAKLSGRKEMTYDQAIAEGEGKMPTQDQVDKFFALTQNETHYLNSKPVAGQEGTFNLMPIEPWDEYDLSNWNSLVRKAKAKGKSLDEAITEASKGALNYFNDLKYYYQKAFRYLDVEEREEYKQLAKDFFSKLQVDNKVRAVGLEEAKVEVDDTTQFKLDLKHLLDKHIVKEASKEEENEFHKELDKLVHKTFGHSSDEKKKSMAQELAETIKLGEGVIEEELCPKGKAYIKRRKAAGEKSSAYLSGRAVKVCKGQMSGRKKKK